MRPPGNYGEPATSEPIRVLVADDDGLARRMICDRLARADIEVVGEARDGDQAVAMALELTPDIVVMDLLMPGLDGFGATTRITSELADVKVVMLSVSRDPEAALLALKAGAVGFLDKSIEIDALLRAVRGVHRGEAALDRLTTRILVDEFQAKSASEESGVGRATQSAGSALSARQRQVLALLAAGLKTDEISVELGLSVETARTHIKAVLRKLRVHSREEATAAALARGILDPAIGQQLGARYPRAGGRPLPREHPRSLQAPAQLEPAGAGAGPA